jgi:hypothetical protein
VLALALMDHRHNPCSSFTPMSQIFVLYSGNL